MFCRRASFLRFIFGSSFSNTFQEMSPSHESGFYFD
jgi:hypothetical protein